MRFLILNEVLAQDLIEILILEQSQLRKNIFRRAGGLQITEITDSSILGLQVYMAFSKLSLYMCLPMNI